MNIRNKKYPKSLSLLFKKNKFDLNILKYIKKHCKKLIKIDNFISNLLPFKLNIFCRVINYKKRILILEVKDSIIKTKINYQTPELICQLRKNILPNLSEIKIIINPYFLSKKKKKIKIKKSNIKLCLKNIKKIKKKYKI